MPSLCCQMQGGDAEKIERIDLCAGLDERCACNLVPLQCVQDGFLSLVMQVMCHLGCGFVQRAAKQAFRFRFKVHVSSAIDEAHDSCRITMG